MDWSDRILRILNNTRVRNYISENYRRFQLYKKVINDKSARVFLFCTPLSTNLGDHAITLAEQYFFRTNFKDKNIYEIPILYTEGLMKTVKKYISPKDLIVINGGGFMGDQWFREETVMRKVISEFPDNKIVVFPQTIFYSNTENGYNEFRKSKKIYSKHNNLYLFAREKRSYDIMKNAYNNSKIFLCPDIVLFGGFRTGSYKRSDILLCFRNDKETQLSDAFKKKIYQELSVLGERIIKVDSAINRYVAIKEREKYTLAKLNDFSKSKLVITDRLHGMIFCVITGTPCIVYSNSNHKIRGVYEWIRNLKYIFFMENSYDLLSVAKSLISQEPTTYDATFLRAEYKPLVDSIKAL